MTAAAGAAVRPHASPAAAEQPLLEVRNLKMHFTVADGMFSRNTASKIKAVDDVSFTIARGETLGLVGESGCGKTTTGRCILHLEKPTSGEIIFEGQNLTNLDRKALNEKRERMQVIFQDPYSSLNPRMKVGDIIGEPMKVHGIYPERKERDQRVAELLSVCGLNPKFMDRYPH
ncbi:MAG: ATP-binding cassette domain-containing protein, partial [Burkholderiales bacterium]